MIRCRTGRVYSVSLKPNTPANLDDFLGDLSKRISSTFRNLVNSIYSGNFEAFNFRESSSDTMDKRLSPVRTYKSLGHFEEAPGKAK